MLAKKKNSEPVSWLLAAGKSCFSHKLLVFSVTSMQNLAGSALFLPQGGTHFQLVPLGSPQGYFMGKFSPLTSIKFLQVIQIILNAELGRLCPFSAPRGHTFSTCPPRFPPRVFHGQIFTPDNSDKHKVSAPNAPLSKSDSNYSPLKKLKRLEKIDFQHTTITLGLVNK